MAVPARSFEADEDPGRGVSACRPTGRSESRTRLLDLSIGFVEDLYCARATAGSSAVGYCADFQVCLPYRGLFIWHVGGDEVVGDPNQVLFVKGNETFRVSGPLPRGYGELIITPDIEILSEVAHASGGALDAHPLFNRRSWRADARLQSSRARFLHWATSAREHDTLEAEELFISLLRSTFRQHGPRHTAGGASTVRLIRRTKEYLEATLPNRLRLADVGRAVGASPAYLTDLFSRVEGMPLHQYLVQLRLARALVELPHSNDLTGLALDLGFSSHSHFTFAFRRAFGATPSEFRNTLRRPGAACFTALP